jgi:alkanesulfonate monooxygenase SsuD/methylene tetrahydromethanopterin reductase-like flavin-dependent oxidoreductase (luciferase family)
VEIGASLQHVSRNRLVLGVGPGGGEAQWAAAGVPYRERGRRTDTALRAPPVRPVRRRVVPVADLAVRGGRRRRPPGRAGHRLRPPGTHDHDRRHRSAGLSRRSAHRRRDRQNVADAYGKDAALAAGLPFTGGPTQVAERLATYETAGASHLVIGLAGPGWRAQCEVLAEARAGQAP